MEFLYYQTLINFLILVIQKINGLNYIIIKYLPESDVNLALKGTVVFYQFVNLNEIVDVISKFD